jgi:hypothetical protein
MGTDKREKEIYAQSCYKQQHSGVGERGKVRKLRGREPSHPCSEYKEPREKAPVVVKARGANE